MKIIMNQDIKSKWVAALRSGEYEQDTKVMHRGGKCFCALGVLCDVSDKGEWVPVLGGEYNSFKTNGSSIASIYQSSWVTPSISFIRAIEWDTREMENIVHMNDIEKCTFEEIAAWIEENI